MKQRSVKLLVFIFALTVFNFSLLTPPALAAPMVSNLQETNITSTAVTITWTTSVPATSQVIFVDNALIQPYRRYPEPYSGSLVTNHSVTINNLLPNTQYSYYVTSIEAGGQIGASGDVRNGVVDTFNTMTVNPAAPFDYRLDISGAANVYAGSDLYYTAKPVLVAGSFPDPDLTTANYFYPFYEVSGLPESITMHALCAYNLDPSNAAGDTSVVGGKEACYGTPALSMRIRAGASTPPGAYTAVVTAKIGSVQKSYSYNFHVIAAPSSIVKQDIGSIPAIPNLAAWESSMTTLARNWCDWLETNPLLFGTESQVWYYDGGRTYFQIGDYTGDVETWLPCAETILDAYANDYVNPNNGQTPTNRKFPHGLAMRYWRYGDGASRQAAINLYNSVSTPYINGAAPIWGAFTTPASMREVAYAIDSMIVGERLGQPRSPWLAMAVDGALAQYDQLFASDPWQFQQPFFSGLMAEALISYYDLTGDPRIPPTIKKMLDWYWDNGVNQTTGQITYNPLYVPPYYLTDLSNLMIPAYAWYWYVSGDSTYQQRGDFLFQHSLDTDISYSGKIFNVNYRWSFDYVRYRSNNGVSTTDPDANSPADIIAPVISSVAAVSSSTSTAAITWTTDENSDTQVEYGPTISYGLSSPLASSLVASHSVNLTGLIANTTYHFRVKSRDNAGNLAISADNTFTTAAVSAPVISSFTASPASVTSGSSAILSWTVTGATSLSINQGIGTITGSSKTVNPAVTTTYTLTAANSGGSAASTATVTVTNSPGGGGPGSGGTGSNNGSAAGNPPANPGSSTSTILADLTSVSVGLRLVNDNGTFYLIQGNKRQGVTSPGILYSYGFEFKDASPATTADLALPLDPLLLPGNGSLVKSQEDPTVYLISNGQRYGFVSASVFLGLGFKWSSVLLVTDPELQSLSKANNLDNPSAAHLPGLDINRNGTIYWIDGDNILHGYPSLAVYDSWHKDGDFSAVVPANAADNSLPVGGLIAERIVQ